MHPDQARPTLYFGYCPGRKHRSHCRHRRCLLRTASHRCLQTVLPCTLGAQTVLVAGISVIAIQVNVVDKAIILISARADAKANIFADGSGEHAAGTRAHCSYPHQLAGFLKAPPSHPASPH